SLYSEKINILGGVSAIAAAGQNSSNTGAAGGGSGGGILCGSKLPGSIATVDVSGAAGGTGYPTSSGQDGGAGGSGRVRLDGTLSSTPTITPSDASQYTGPTTDTTSWIAAKSLTLTGTGNGNKTLLYVRGESTPWRLVDSVSSTSWSKTIALSPCDSLFFIVAAQEVPAPSTATYTAEPSWVLSQAAANIVHGGLTTDVTLSAGTNQKICFGDSVAIGGAAANGQSPYTYTWTPTTGLSSGRVLSPKASPNMTTTYIVTATDANGCQGLASVTITVNPLPHPLITQSKNELCVGDTLMLRTTGSLSYLWSNGSATQNLIVDSPGIYRVMATDSNGCTGYSKWDTVKNYPVPAPVIVASKPGLCQGEKDSVLLRVTGGTFQSVDWGGGHHGRTFNINSPGMYQVVVVDMNGCMGTASIPIPTVSATQPKITVIGSNPHCVGSTVTLATNNGYAGYLWTPSGEKSASIKVSGAGVYRVLVTDANGCSAISDSVLVTADSLNPRVIASRTSFCPGDTAILRGDRKYSGYAWSPNGETSDSIRVTKSGVYYFRATDQGCSGVSNSVSITVSNLLHPHLTTSGLDTLCFGGSVTLFAGKYDSVLWYPNTGRADSIVAATSGLYYADVKSGACEGRSDSVRVVVLPALQIRTIPSDSQSVCGGDSLTLTADAGFARYLWNPTNDTTQSIKASKSGSYYVTGTDQLGCTAVSNAVVLTVIPPIAASILPHGIITICGGGDTVLTARPDSMSYEWFDSTGAAIGDGQRVRVSTAGLYRVIVTTPDGCSASAFDTVNAYTVASTQITADPAAVNDTLLLCSSSTATLKASFAIHYLWSTGETTDTIVISKAGSYFVTIMDSNGCATASQAITVIRPSHDFALSTSPDTAICADSGAVYTRTVMITNPDSVPQMLHLHSTTGNTFTPLPDSIVVAAGQTDTLPISVTTDGTARTYRATYDIEDSCSGTAIAFNLFAGRRTISPVLQLIAPTSAVSGNGGDTVVFGIRITDSLPPCITALHFSLSHNDDYLEYLGIAHDAPDTSITLDRAAAAEGTLTQWFTTTRRDAGLIGELRFRVYLTKSDSTMLSLSGVQYDDTCSLPGPCISSIQSSDASYDYIYACGGDLLRQAVSGVPVAFGRIIPNPARDEFHIAFTKPEGWPVHYEIDDVLGRMLASGETTDAQLTLSARDLPQGMLLFRASAKGFVQTRRFVVVK
ncbi:MAG TPA: hypothetical protein VFD13_02745, partial [Candidatus Kapabacteria bacterium]|nr:hypothetical protein [Candidatus Kapabacteria bacterium]